LAWSVEIDARAARELAKLDRQVSHRILRFLRERVASLPDPRSIGGPLRGSELGEFWKYRVGDYRLICSIEDDRLIVLVLRIAHRREVYSR
jgi:mRNA interferase RelE/StbE